APGRGSHPTCWTRRWARAGRPARGPSRWGGGRPSAVSTPGGRGRSTGTARRTGSDRKSTRLNSSHVKISYAVFCLKKKNTGISRLIYETIYSFSHHDTIWLY